MTKIQNKLKKFDIKKVFEEKNAKMARRIPNLVYRLISKVLHVNYLNYIIENYGHLEGVDFIDAMIKEFNISFEYRGLENIPSDGKFIFTASAVPSVEPSSTRNTSKHEFSGLIAS